MFTTTMTNSFRTFFFVLICLVSLSSLSTSYNALKWLFFFDFAHAINAPCGAAVTLPGRIVYFVAALVYNRPVIVAKVILWIIVDWSTAPRVLTTHQMQDFSITARLGAGIISLTAAFEINHIVEAEVRLRVVHRLGATTGIPQRNFAEGYGRTGTAEVP